MTYTVAVLPDVARATKAAALVAVMLAIACAANAQPSPDKVQICNSCHGENGVPQDKSIPVIWGQTQGYLYLQLRDYKRGDRKNEPMQAIVAKMERSDMMAVAEYYSQKPWPDLRQLRAPGPVAARALQANVAVGCTGCDLGEYQGAGTQPRLAGQIKDYMAQTMIAFRTGERGNNPGMSDLMKAISEEDIAALAEYLAGL